jgi:hypothetical protein
MLLANGYLEIPTNLQGDRIFQIRAFGD